MTTYCKCNLCKASPAQPKKGTADNKTPEEIRGGLITLGDNDVLCHWSSREFARQLSVELRDIKVRGVNPVAITCSYFLYRNTPQPPLGLPQSLRLMGLAGQHRYTIQKAAAEGASIYLRDDRVSNGPSEVVVVIGCGGSIAFDRNRNATSIESAEIAGGKAHSKRSAYKLW